jgi:hypothetical protein
MTLGFNKSYALPFSHSSKINFKLQMQAFHEFRAKITKLAKKTNALF